MIQSFMYWKMAMFRCLVYMIVVSLGNFLFATESYSGEEWKDLSFFERGRIFATCVNAALGALLAFLDQTMAKLTAGKSGELKL